jgi:general secretion pathway protein D
MKAGNFDLATASYQQMLRLHPEDERAPAGLAAVAIMKRNVALEQEADEAIKRGDYDVAKSKLQIVLTQSPNDEKALALMKVVEEKAGEPQGGDYPTLAPSFRKPVTVEFREAPTRSVFEALSRQSGINFVFDKDVRPDDKITAFARNTAISDVLDMLLATSHLARKTLNSNTVLIYPNTPAKKKDYEDMVVRAFFLTNLAAKDAMNMVRTLTKNINVYVDEKLNVLYVRDTPEAVKVVKNLLAVADQSEAEVMLDVEVLEISRSRLMDLGVQWPNQLSVITPTQTTNSTVVNGVIETTTTPATNLTIDTLRHLHWGDLGVSPNPSINIGATDGDVNLLANPRIRVRNREKASIHIGDKVPVITSNVTSTGVTSESVSYLDVGLKLDVEPRVHLDNEVDIKVGLEVSNIAQQIKTSTGTVAYQLGSRSANTLLQLKDGETQVLAGLISDEDRSSMNKVPGLGDIPLLNHLFGTSSTQKSKTEIVLLITPHVLRNVQRPSLSESEFFAGTEANASDRPLLLRAVGGLPPAPAIPAPAAPPVQTFPARPPQPTVPEAATPETSQTSAPPVPQPSLAPVPDAPVPDQNPDPENRR